MIKRLCSRCNAIATKGNRCDKHPLTHGWQHTKTRHERGYGNDWVKLRAKVLKRDDYLCQPCKQANIYREAKQVDHIINKAIGGTNDLDNLQAICIDCHKAKTRQESTEARTQIQKI